MCSFLVLVILLAGFDLFLCVFLSQTVVLKAPTLRRRQRRCEADAELLHILSASRRLYYFYLFYFVAV